MGYGADPARAVRGDPQHPAPLPRPAGRLRAHRRGRRDLLHAHRQHLLGLHPVAARADALVLLAAAVPPEALPAGDSGAPAVGAPPRLTATRTRPPSPASRPAASPASPRAAARP